MQQQPQAPVRWERLAAKSNQGNAAIVLCAILASTPAPKEEHMLLPCSIARTQHRPAAPRPSFSPGIAMAFGTLLLMAALPDTAWAVSPSCASSAVDVTSSDQQGDYTTSQTFVDIPEGAVRFNQPTTGCIIVKFDGYSYAPGEGEMVAAFLDGTEIWPDDIVLASGDENAANSHAASWFATNVPAGVHTVQMEYRSYDGAYVYMHRHTTAVWHK
ncbi:MAG TPA: hypothetical protein VKR31_08720 [Rhizomicrobium sp.]|nr:hypothetical protein [Rhizomicrobium sp.]